MVYINTLYDMLKTHDITNFRHKILPLNNQFLSNKNEHSWQNNRY